MLVTFGKKMLVGLLLLSLVPNNDDDQRFPPSWWSSQSQLPWVSIHAPLLLSIRSLICCSVSATSKTRRWPSCFFGDEDSLAPRPSSFVSVVVSTRSECKDFVNPIVASTQNRQSEKKYGNQRANATFSRMEHIFKTQSPVVLRLQNFPGPVAYTIRSGTYQSSPGTVLEQI